VSNRARTEPFLSPSLASVRLTHHVNRSSHRHWKKEKAKEKKKNVKKKKGKKIVTQTFWFFDLFVLFGSAARL